MEVVYWYVGKAIYCTLGLIAIWGAFCVIIVWRRVAQTRFRNEDEQDAFLDKVDESLEGGDFEGAIEFCDNDGRAMSQLALLAIVNRERGYKKIRSLVADRFQRDVLSDLEYRLSWVYTVIKSAPMVGLLGTVVGMMGAFTTLADPNSAADPAKLADDISLALVTTACGLAIAIPLVIATASINVRIRKLEDLVAAGVTRFLETFKAALINAHSEKG
ncbi:MAG: MotA/TolQ/ExbB proton channel family protein [Thermoguttaceae bacterium]